jgi:ketosteroid isomerase-like protein
VESDRNLLNLSSAQGPPQRSAREVSESYWAAECRRDIDAVLAHYRADASYEDAGGLCRGHAEIRAAYEAGARAYPSLEVVIVREFPSRDVEGLSAIEFDANVTSAGGHVYRVRGVNVVQVRDGKFVSVRSYEDPAV